jgi:iron complex transport system substrate-binding protein
MKIQRILLIFLLQTTLIVLAALSVFCGDKKAKQAKKIVSLSPSATEQIFILGEEDNLLGCTNYCVRPVEAGKKEKIGTVLELNLEKIAALDPDIVIASSLTRPEAIDKIKELGFNVVIFNSPKDFKTFFRQFIELGELLGEKDKAAKIASESERKIFSISSLVSGAGNKPKVLFQLGTNPLYAAGNDSFVQDFILCAGGINVFGDKKSAAYSKEMILAANPDVILITDMGTLGEREKNEWMRFSSINAVQNKRIFICDANDVCCPSPPNLPITVAKIASLFFPNYAQKIKECVIDKSNEK